MFSTQQKREIADAIQRLLRATGHPELPAGEIPFVLHVDGAEPWSWADIRNNGAVITATMNLWNEWQAGAVWVCSCGRFNAMTVTVCQCGLPLLR